MRTGLAFLAGAAALGVVDLDLPPAFHGVAALALSSAGLACGVQAWRGWSRRERALRTGAPLPGPGAGLLLAAVVVVVAVAVAGLSVARLL